MGRIKRGISFILDECAASYSENSFDDFRKKHRVGLARIGPAVGRGSYAGVEPLKHRWFKQKEPFDVSTYVSKAKVEIEDIHRSLREKIEDFDQSLAPVLRKNAQFIEQQIDFVERIVQKRYMQNMKQSCKSSGVLSIH